MLWPGPSVTVSSAKSESAIVKGRKTSWARWDWSLTLWCCGAVVLWNSLYMQEALSHIRTTTGETPDDEHIARLSPLMHGHINMLGHYTFTLPEDILKGESRPLNININNELSS